MVTLISSDGDRFEMPEAAARLSQTVLDEMEKDDYHAYNGIPLPNVAAAVLAKVMTYCTNHTSVNSEANGSSSSNAVDDTAKTSKEEELKNFDDEFILLNNRMLYDLIKASDDMRMEGLMDLSCRRVADKLNSETVQQMRQTLGIIDDFTPEEIGRETRCPHPTSIR